jgi:hypothetical protein
LFEKIKMIGKVYVKTSRSGESASSRRFVVISERLRMYDRRFFQRKTPTTTIDTMPMTPSRTASVISTSSAKKPFRFLLTSE